MNLFSAPEVKVGALVIVVATLIGVMSLRLSEGPGMLSRGKEFYFDVPDAGGLVKNSSVRMAGIKVGTIKDIVLVDGKARVHIQLDSEVPLTTSGRVEIRADGILGDKHVEIVPGKVGDPEVPSGTSMNVGENHGSLDKVMADVSKITESLTKLVNTLNKAAEGQGDRESVIGRIMLNVEGVTEDLKELTAGNKSKINGIVDNVSSITKSLDGFLNDDGSDGLKGAMRKVKDSLAKLDRSMKNIEEITEKINSGQGTIGRLINDEETVDELNSAISNVNNFLGSAARMETAIDFHSEYLANSEISKSYLTVRLQPGLDRYYELGIVDDPKGLTTTTVTKTTPTGGATSEVEEQRTFKNRIKFSALFAKNFYDFTLKGGIFENAGGVGFDYFLLKRKLRFSLEAFDFEDFQLRAFARYDVGYGLYLVGGGDDLTGKGRDVNAFVGAGFFLTNDDLKMFATRLSF